MVEFTSSWSCENLDKCLKIVHVKEGDDASFFPHFDPDSVELEQCARLEREEGNDKNLQWQGSQESRKTNLDFADIFCLRHQFSIWVTETLLSKTPTPISRYMGWCLRLGGE